MSSLLTCVLSYRLVKNINVKKINSKKYDIKKYKDKAYGKYLIQNVLYSELSGTIKRKKKS